MLSIVYITLWSLTNPVVTWWSKIFATIFVWKKILIPALRFTRITADVESCWVASWVTSWSLMFTTDLSHLSHYSSGATHVNSKCHALSTMEAMQLQSYALFWLFQAIQRKLCFFYPPPPSNVFMRDKERIIYLEMGGGGMGEGWEVYWKWRGLTKHAVKIDGKRQWARQWAWYSLYA